MEIRLSRTGSTLVLIGVAALVVDDIRKTNYIKTVNGYMDGVKAMFKGQVETEEKERES